MVSFFELKTALEKKGHNFPLYDRRSRCAKQAIYPQPLQKPPFFGQLPKGQPFPFGEPPWVAPQKGKSPPPPPKGGPPLQRTTLFGWSSRRGRSWLVDCLFSAARSLLVRNICSVLDPEHVPWRIATGKGIRPTVGSSRSATPAVDPPVLLPSPTWRIIPVSKWLITMVSKSPKWCYSPYECPKLNINGGYTNYLLSGMILQV